MLWTIIYMKQLSTKKLLHGLNHIHVSYWFWVVNCLFTLLATNNKILERSLSSVYIFLWCKWKWLGLVITKKGPCSPERTDKNWALISHYQLRSLGAGRPILWGHLWFFDTFSLFLKHLSIPWTTPIIIAMYPGRNFITIWLGSW